MEERYGATVVVMKKIKRSVWHFSVSFVEGDKQRAEHAATIAILMKPAIPSPLRIAVRAYRYQLDEIGHDPYQLISHLTAVYEQFTRGQVKTVIKSLFEQQYLLKVWETIEIRTRMETRVGIRPTIDAFGNVSMETYTYQEEVEYEYKMTLPIINGIPVRFFVF